MKRALVIIARFVQCGLPIGMLASIIFLAALILSHPASLQIFSDKGLLAGVAVGVIFLIGLLCLAAVAGNREIARALLVVGYADEANEVAFKAVLNVVVLFWCCFLNLVLSPFALLLLL